MDPKKNKKAEKPEKKHAAKTAGKHQEKPKATKK